MSEHAPGWYEHEGERRYWDGTQWTHASSKPATPPPPSPTASQPVPNQVVPYAPPPTYGAGAPPFATSSPYPGSPPPYPGALPVARKEPAIALVVSFLIPGVGSMMNGDVGAGVGFLGLYIFGIVMIVCLGWFFGLGLLIGVPLMLVAWGWGMYHAYQGAVDFNRRAGYQN